MIRSNATETLPMRIPSIGGSIGQRYMFTHMQYLGSNFVSGLKLKQHFIMKLCCCVNQVARTNLFISMNKIQSTLMTQNQSILRLFPIALAWKNSLKSMNKVQSTLMTQKQSIFELFPIALAWKNSLKSMNKVQSTSITQNQSIVGLFPIALAWQNSLKSMNKVQSTLITSQSINCHTLSNSFNVTISTLDVKAALLFK